MEIGSSEEIKKDHEKVQKKDNDSFFSKLFGSLFKSNSPDAEKKRKLKAIAKNFSKTKYHNFYKPNTSEVQGSFAKLMYEIYKATSQAQVYFKNTNNPALFKRQIINYSLSENQLALLEHFDEQKIMEMARKMPIANIENQLENELQTFTNEFDSERASRAENLYKSFTLFKEFCEYDYYVLLKKFDNTIQEFQFNAPPRLDKISDEYIIEDLKDFVAVAYSITDDSVAWTDLFNMFKETSGRELITLGNWKKIVAKIKSIQLSQSFELMIQLISKDPKYRTEVKYHYESLVEPYVDQIQNEVRTVISKISAQQKENKTNSICMQIFGTANPSSLVNFTAGFNGPLEKKGLDTLEYTEPLNYLKTFINEYVKKDLHEFYDVVVIRGQWDATLSAPMSNAYQELMKTGELITQFDNSFADEGPAGLKIKTLLPKTARDSGAENIINRVIADGNDQAKDFLLSATQNLVVIGKTMKQLIEDYSLPKPVLVMNWKELDKYVEQPIKEFSVNLYKKIYLFVQLMQTYLK